jgi:hypothetical protein
MHWTLLMTVIGVLLALIIDSYVGASRFLAATPKAA